MINYPLCDKRFDYLDILKSCKSPINCEIIDSFLKRLFDNEYEDEREKYYN
jgi:hypothetical protein